MKNQLQRPIKIPFQGLPSFISYIEPLPLLKKMKKKPDGVVWDETHETYFAKLLPYASNLSGPIIEIPNVDSFKKKGVDRVSKQFQAELKDLQDRIKSFVTLASETQKVYEAHFKFEPIVGEIYHLYQGKIKLFFP